MPWTESARAKLLAPAPLQDAGFRRWIEIEAMISFAGRATEFHLAPNFRTGYVPPQPDEQRAEQLSRLATIYRKEADRLDAVRQQLIPRDQETAGKLAWSLTGPTTSAAYLRWLTAETDDLVRRPNLVRLVETFVPDLLDRTTVPGRLARRILNDTMDTIKEERRASERA